MGEHCGRLTRPFTSEAAGTRPRHLASWITLATPGPEEPPDVTRYYKVREATLSQAIC